MWEISALSPFIVVLAVSLGYAVGPSAPASAGEGAMDVSDPRDVPLRFRLREVGEKLDCYFTIERLADSPTTRSPFTTLDFDVAGVQTIDELVARINKKLPSVTAVRDEVKASVIHLSETALPRTKDYGMDRKVTTKFKGTPRDFLVHLNREVPSIGPRIMEPIPNVPQDHTTPIDVDVRDVPVRDLLTSAVPLEGYQRIIWEAYTLIHDNKPNTRVMFYGRK